MFAIVPVPAAAPARAPAPAPRALRLRRDGGACVPAGEPARVPVAKFEVLNVPPQLLVQDRVLDDVLWWGDEDLAPAERDDREDDEHHPCHAHQDRHDNIPVVEELGVKDVADLAQGEDPSH